MEEKTANAAAPAEAAFVPERIANRNDLPRRARSILGTVLDQCRTHLADTLSNALDEFQKQLFQLSEIARNSEQQQNYFISARELHNVRAQIIPRFLEMVEDFLATYDKRERETASAAPAAAKPASNLSLVETGELEESLALQEFVARAEVRHSEALFFLGHRFAVLAALPALDAKVLPIGPAHIAHALRHAAEVLTISAEHRVLLYRVFDQLANKDLVALYKALNEYFIEQHILKHMRAQATKTRRARGASADAGGSEDDEQQDGDADADAGGTSAGGGSAGTRGARGGQAKRGARGVLGRDAQGSVPGANSSPSPRAGDWFNPHSLQESQDVELFSTLQNLLANSRASGAGSGFGSTDHADGNGTLPPNAYMPSSEDVQGVLGALQNKPPGPFPAGEHPYQQTIAELKREMLQQLRELSPTRETPHLQANDSDTIDLLGMLFDHMTAGHAVRDDTQQLISRLQVPLLRVALEDKSFFTRSAHPARQLLNTVTEASERWIDGSDTEADGDLQQKLKTLIERLTTEFDGDLNVIEDLFGDLSGHLQTLKRKADVVERRQVDAAIGREKLAVARETAANAMADRISANPPQPFVRTLLEQAWSDVLALTLLRQGEASPVYRKRVEVADQLIEASAAVAKGAPAPEPTEELREELEAGLSQVGYHDEDIQAVVKRLFVTDAAANEDISETELVEKLNKRPRLGGDDKMIEDRPLQTAARRREALNLNASEMKILEDLKQVPFGTWFDFTINQQGDRMRKKLAWASRLTDRCMFVNQRGVRTDDTTLGEIARHMARGQISIVPAETDSFVDRAWSAIVTSLKRFSSLASVFAPPPAEPAA